MKNLMLLMSLVVLVSCNGKDSDRVRRSLEEDAYSQEEEDSLNCNDEVLGWSEKVPGNLESAQKSLNANPEFEQCGNFDLYVDEIIDLYPRAGYLRQLLQEDNEERNEEYETEEESNNDLTDEQMEALNCNEEFLQLDSNPPATLEEAKGRMSQNRGYKKCGFFELYIDEVTFSNPEVDFLKELIKK